MAMGYEDWWWGKENTSNRPWVQELEKQLAEAKAEEREKSFKP
jgi:hypothetical protein